MERVKMVGYTHRVGGNTPHITPSYRSVYALYTMGVSPVFQTRICFL